MSECMRVCDPPTENYSVEILARIKRPVARNVVPTKTANVSGLHRTGR